MDPAVGGAAAGLGAAATWGAADFTGGYASRSTHPLRVAAWVQAVGFVLLVAIVLLVGEPLASFTDLGWGAAAGLSGILGLLAFYVALSTGRMGVAAPVAGVVAALLPVTFTLVTAGSPGVFALVGFVLAFLGIALVSGEPGATSRRSLLYALAAGVGFGGFLVFISRTSGESFVWPLISVRIAGGALVAAMILLLRPQAGPGVPTWVLLTAALLDTGGNVFFLLASRLGRLDVAAVLSSLYPGATVLLARVVLRERLTTLQSVGVAVLLVAILLVVGPWDAL